VLDGTSAQLGRGGIIERLSQQALDFIIEKVGQQEGPGEVLNLL
jgi:hypothetical protein